MLFDLNFDAGVVLQGVVDHLEDGITLLLDPRAHHVGDRLPRHVGPSLPKVRSLSVPVGVPGEISRQTLPEVLGAEQRVDHPHDAASLGIGDRVKHLFDLLSPLDGHLNRVAIAEAVEFKRPALLVNNKRLPKLPARLKLVRCKGLHPIGEALVEPEVVPPRHCHEVAEPLMGELVRYHDADSLLLGHGRSLEVAQEVHLTIRHQAPILHRSGREIRNGDHVQLRQGVRHAEKVVVEFQGPDATIQGVSALAALPGNGEYAHGRSSLRYAGDALKVPDAEGQEVRAHLGRSIEDLLAPPVRAHLAAGRRHVGECSESSRVDERDREVSLPRGLCTVGGIWI
mmetsp:Transcript_104110/g.293600  ORF Transcript_104110/g.293600 Transcript_104110/m.293600 type:complete len:341 (+) Transcript_104110:1440-2462(+)